MRQPFDKEVEMVRIVRPSRRQVLKASAALGAAAAAGPFFHVGPAKADKGELVVASWGGSWAKALREVMFDDFEKMTGIKVTDDGPPEAAKVKAMVESGNVTWDILDTDVPAILTMMKNNLLMPLDYSKIDADKLGKIPKVLHHSHAIGHKIYSFNIVYNSKTFPRGKQPASWADVWNGEKFKGARSFNFRGGIYPQLEFALLADGVATDQLYPLDVERAWRIYDKLRPLVTKWYGSHAEAIQLLSTGEVDIACTVGPRGISAKRAGAPIDVDYSQGKLAADNWAIVRGAKNPEAAHQFINFALAGERQAGMSKRDPYGPSNPDAFKFLSESEAADLTTSPANIKSQFWHGVDWWSKVGPDNKTEAERQTERYAAWMLRRN
jgi:putative spermidine/putrescine transport system substrate-binding protein